MASNQIAMTSNLAASCYYIVHSNALAPGKRPIEWTLTPLARECWSLASASFHQDLIALQLILGLWMPSTSKQVT